MSDPRPFHLLAILTLMAGVIAMPAFAQPSGDRPADSTGTLLSVSAQGEASRVPDIASMSVGVVSQAAEGQAAMRDNAQRMTRVLAAIRGAGIADDDIQTTGVSLHPQYRHVRDEAPRVTGYEARNTVRIKVRDRRAWGGVDTLAAEGANRSTARRSRSTSRTGPRRGAWPPGQGQARAETYAGAGPAGAAHCQHQ